MLTNVSGKLQRSPGGINSCTALCFLILHNFLKCPNSRRRKLVLVNLVSLLPDFRNDLWRLRQIKSTLTSCSKADKACCFITSFVLIYEVKKLNFSVCLIIVIVPYIFLCKWVKYSRILYFDWY